MSENKTVVPIENPINPTQPITNPYADSGALVAAPIDVAGVFMVVFMIAFGVLIAYLAFKWMKKQDKITLDEVNPTLDDLDSGGFSLNTYLAIQGGMAVMISVVCTLSLIFVLVEPGFTIAVCGATIGLTGYARELGKNNYREKYKNKKSLSGYMRDITGKKRKYDWSNCSYTTAYTPHEDMYAKLKAHMEGSVSPDKEPKKDIAEVTKNVTLTKQESDSTKAIRESTKIDDPDIEATPVMIGDNYLVIVITKGELNHVLELIDVIDYDIFGDYTIPGAGPEFREVAKLHRVKVNPVDKDFRIDEYIPVFVSVWDDRMSREAVKIVDSIDMETSDIIHGTAKAMGVERKHTAGEINTAVAQTLDLLNESRDFDLITSADADRKADMAVKAKEKIAIKI